MQRIGILYSCHYNPQSAIFTNPLWECTIIVLQAVDKHIEFTDTYSFSTAIFVIVVDFCLVISALHEQIYTEGRVFLSVSPPAMFHIGLKICLIRKMLRVCKDETFFFHSIPSNYYLVLIPLTLFNLSINMVEPVCCKKRPKIVPDQLLVWGIRVLWRFWMVPNWS